MRRILVTLLAAAMILLCAGAAMAEGNVLQFDRSLDTVFEGETLQTVLTREGAPAGGLLTYTTGDAKIATVDENGIVTGLARGQTNITATVTADGRTFRAQLRVNVLRRATELEVRTDRLPLYAADDPTVAGLIPEDPEKLPVLLVPEKKSLNLQVTVLPKDASNHRFTLTSADETVVRTSGSEIRGMAQGLTTVTVASESNPEVNVRYRVLVIRPVKSITVQASAPAVTVGGQVQVNAVIAPEDATVKKVQWTSGDERYVTVDENGTVTGIRRGNGRIIVTAADGTGARANFSLKVSQLPESLTLSAEEVTLDTGRNMIVKATVAPADADNKKVLWSSSDEGIAKVGKDGRITGVAPGECTVTCVSEAMESVTASLTVHVQQPVKKLTFTEQTVTVYAGEDTKLEWVTEPADATNPGVAFSSSDERIATVSPEGTVTGVKAGSTYINAVTTDGSNRKARIKVTVGQHVTGVHMVRNHAYIDLHETATAGATLEPKDATNKNMTWVSSDESVVTATGKTNHKMKLKGVGYGEATVTGTTEDGGFETSIDVTVGDFDRCLSFRDFGLDDKGNFWLIVRNDSAFTITQITASLEMYDATEDGLPKVEINTKDGSNKVDIVWSGTLAPGETTGTRHWKMSNYRAPSKGIYTTRGTVTLYSFQIENDWIKTIREHNRTTKDY